MSTYPPQQPAPQATPPSSLGHGVKIGIGIVVGIILITGLLIVVFMGGCVACFVGGVAVERSSNGEASSTPGTPISNATVGERVDKSGVALTVQSVKRQKSLGRFDRAGANNTYLIAEVTIE